MSPHETLGWTHAMCDACWWKHGNDRDPVRMRGEDAEGNPGFHSQPCCFCGEPTQGIYVRKAAAEVASRRGCLMGRLTLARLIVRVEPIPEARDLLLDVLYRLRRFTWRPKQERPLPPRSETRPVPERRSAA